jgi:hypothetical protein
MVVLVAAAVSQVLAPVRVVLVILRLLRLVREMTAAAGNSPPSQVGAAVVLIVLAARVWVLRVAEMVPNPALTPHLSIVLAVAAVRHEPDSATQAAQAVVEMVRFMKFKTQQREL